jgi:hypothetical protein
LGELIVLSRFPEDLAEDAKRKFGVRGGKVQTVNEAANLFVSGCCRAALLGTTGV